MNTIFVRFFCLSIFLSAALLAGGQSDALVFRPSGGDEEAASPSAHKTETARKVYEHLVEARGDNRFNAPDFELAGTVANGARILYDENRIILEEKAYDVCTRFGADSINALATLLAHELIHFYEKHGWAGKFSSSFAGLQIGDTLGRLSTKIINETQADYLGGFLAYSAGYDVFRQGDEFMAALYEKYGLGEQVKGYPSLSDRKAMIRSSAEKVVELADIFDVANLMAITARSEEEFQIAQMLYEYILDDYQSRELYNNLGVLATYQALLYFRENELKYRFPLQLELEFRSARGAGALDTRTALLRKAVRCFDYAIGLDAGYAPAYLNKACALTLLEEYPRARFYAMQEALDKAGPEDKHMAGSVEVLLGIIASREGMAEEAGGHFDRAIALGSSLGDYNKKVLLGEEPGREDALGFAPGLSEEIDGVDLISFTRRGQQRGKPQPGIKIADKVNFYRFLLEDAPDNSKVMIIVSTLESSRGAYYLFQATGKGYGGATREGIRAGDGREAVAAAYGQPAGTLLSANGEIMKYSNILFFLGPDKKVRKWAVVEDTQ